MTTLGGNIHAVEVEGTFDDCQHLVKTALADRELVRALNLTTANSINLGRLIPQITYYVWGTILAGQLLGERGTLSQEPLFAVPSGNFGNLTAATYAKRMGAPIAGFISASNANDVVPEYFNTGVFKPRPSLQTYSNAMDVGNPSNFARLQALYDNDLRQLQGEITAVSVGDDETLEEIKRTYDRCGYVLDPHTAVGVAAARRRGSSGMVEQPTIVAATAHPAKFPDVITLALNRSVPIPPQLEEAMNRPKQSVRIPAVYDHVRRLLASQLAR